MKRYSILLIAVLALLLGMLAAGIYVAGKKPAARPPIPGAVLESETVREENEVVNQEHVMYRQGELTAGEETEDSQAAAESSADSKEKEYCLVAEDEFLFVFARDRESVCLDTHMPLTEFPVEEQERLLDGIWFYSMQDVLSYLESFTS